MHPNLKLAETAYQRALINHPDPTIGFSIPFFLHRDYKDCKVPDLTELRHAK